MDGGIVVYYESLNLELKTKPIYEFRCDERQQTKSEEFTRLGYTLLLTPTPEDLSCYVRPDVSLTSADVRPQVT